MKEKMKNNEKNEKKSKKILPLAMAGLTMAMACTMSACGTKDDTDKNDNGAVTYWTVESAYAQAQTQGFEGTFEDFLKSIAGITSATISTDAASKGHLILTLTTGGTVDVGKVTGEDGSDGRGIADIRINSATGKLEVKFTGETTYTPLSKVVGEDGKGIAEMKVDSDGVLKFCYTNSTNVWHSLINTNTLKGVGVQSAVVATEGEKAGHLIITLTDSSTIDAGIAKGSDGKSITATTINNEGKLIITFSDGSNIEVGNVKGDKGETGVGVANILHETDRWGLKVKTTYIYTDDTMDNTEIETEKRVSHREVFEDVIAPDFGRLYNVSNEDELKYLLELGVTNFALNNNIYLSSDITLKTVTTGRVMTVYEQEYIEPSEEEGEGSLQLVAKTKKVNYQFDLNGNVFGTSKLGKLVIEDGVNVYFDNGKIGSSFDENSFEFDEDESMLYVGEKFDYENTIMIISSAAELESAKDDLEYFEFVIFANSEENLRGMLNYAKTNSIDNLNIVIADDIDFSGSGEGAGTDNSCILIRGNATIDLNGHKLSNSNYEGVYGVISVLGNLTINGEGTVEACCKNAVNQAGEAEHINPAIRVWGKLTINGGNYINTNSLGDENHYDLIYICDASAEVTVNGGYFEGKTPEWSLNIKDDCRTGGKFIVKGGTFKNFNPATDRLDDGTTIADGYKVVAEKQDEDVYYTVSKNKNSAVYTANEVFEAIKTNVYNNEEKLGKETTYTLEGINTALGENALTGYFVDMGRVSDDIESITLGGSVYAKDQEITLSIGNSNFLKTKAFEVRGGKLYVAAPIVATSSAETTPYTIKNVTADSGIAVEDKGEGVYNVKLSSGKAILWVAINEVESSDIILRKSVEGNGLVSFGFTNVEEIGTDYGYGLYPIGWVADLSKIPSDFTRTDKYSIYIAGKGVVHFTLNISL